MITSNVSLADRESAQLLIDITTSEGQQSGLAHISAVECENLHTLPMASVQHKLGLLSPALMKQIDDCLRSSLGIR